MAKMAAKKPPAWRRTFIREWRQAKGMNLADLAEAMGLSEPYLSQLENGRRRYNQDMLELASDALGVPVAYLLSRKPPPSDAAELDYSDPYVAVEVLENLPSTDRRHIGGLIKSYKDAEPEGNA